MQKTSKSILIYIALGLVALTGWPLWFHASSNMSQAKATAQQYKQLNDILLTDVQEYQNQNLPPSPIIRRVQNISSDEQAQTIAYLKDKNKFLEEKMTAMRRSFQKQIRDLLKAELAMNRPAPKKRITIENHPDTVQLGTLSVTGLGAVYETEKGPSDLSFQK